MNFHVPSSRSFGHDITHVIRLRKLAIRATTLKHLLSSILQSNVKSEFLIIFQKLDHPFFLWSGGGQE